MLNSKPVQSLLIATAAALSVFPFVAERYQHNSIRWTFDGEQVHCEYFRVPDFSHVRSYDPSRIIDITTAPDSRDPKVTVVRLSFDGLNVNIPSQSDELIWGFDRYVQRLQRFFERVRLDDRDAVLTWYHSWLVAGAAAVPLAVVAWVLVFGVLLTRSRHKDSDDSI